VKEIMNKRTFTTLLIGIALGVAVILAYQMGLPCTSVSVTAVSDSEKTLAGLAVGAEVRVCGVVAGQVKQMRPLDHRRVELKLRIKRKFSGTVRTDSTLVVRRKFGIAGVPYLDLTVGQSAPLLPDSTNQLNVVRDKELDQRTQQIVHSIAKMIVTATDTNSPDHTETLEGSKITQQSPRE
jgi:ABC-type transporter Mla subunit MlaD